MSYDYQLNRADGYMEPHGYVHVGWKVVLKFGNTLMPWWPLEQSEFAYSDCEMQRDHRLRVTHFRRPLFHFLSEAAKNYESIITSFPPRLLIEDKVGFHVAATEQQALGFEEGFGTTNPFGTRRQSRITMPKFDARRYSPYELPPFEECEFSERYVVDRPGALCRVLVPERAVRFVAAKQFSEGKGCFRCKAIVVIPPDEKETAQDIALCDTWNRLNGWKPEPQERTDAAGKETIEERATANL